MKHITLLIMLVLAFQLYANVPDSLATKPLENSAPVLFKENVLFYIHSDYGPYSSWERAKTVSERLKELSAIKKVNRDSLLIDIALPDYHIRYGNKLLVSIVPADSLLLGASMQAIATQYHRILADHFIPLVSKESLRQRIFDILKVILILVMIILLTRYLLKLLGKMITKLLGLVQILRFKHRHGFHVKGVQLVSSQQLDKVLSLFVKMIRGFSFVIIIYTAFHLMLYVIPGTRPFARALQNYIMSPLLSIGNALLDYIPNVFFILVILFIAKYILKTLRYVFDEIEKGHLKLPGFYTEWAIPTFQMVRIMIFLFVAIIIFPYLPGSQSPAFRGISVFVGVLFSLGSSSAIANMVSGIILTYMRPYKVGDIIQIADVTGELMETSLLVIRLKTFKQVEVTIPNSVVLSGKIVDYSRYANEDRLIIHTKVTIGYDVPWEKVHALLLEAAKRTEGLNQDLNAFVLQTKLDDHYVEYELNAFTSFPSVMPKILSDIHQNIQDTFAEAGVEIMSPMYNAVRDGNAITLPKG